MLPMDRIGLMPTISPIVLGVSLLLDLENFIRQAQEPNVTYPE